MWIKKWRLTINKENAFLLLYKKRFIFFEMMNFEYLKICLSIH